jgi:hypothetical protein
MLHAAYAAAGSDGVASLPTVFASRYGELALTVALLESLARSEPLTAARFTHSIHNTQIGLFSIAARNRGMATAVSAGPDTFPYAIVEALALLERCGRRGGVLVVVADEPVPATFDVFDREPAGPYALALVLEPGGSGHRVGLVQAAGDAVARRPPWPQAIEFLRWLLSDEPSVTLGVSRPWAWHRW